MRESEIEDENQRIDSLIRDEHGRILWKKYFLGRVRLPPLGHMKRTSVCVCVVMLYYVFSDLNLRSLDLVRLGRVFPRFF